MSTPRGLAITNPLTLYRSLIALKKLQPDPAQHRLAIELQKLYFSLKDYEPEVEYRHQLKQFSRGLGLSTNNGRPNIAGSSFGYRQPKLDSSLALTKRLTDHESAIHLQSPKGLLVHGEVGSGKTEIVNLLAEGLPTTKKGRWHYSTFMLEVFSRLDKQRLNTMPYDDDANEHSLLCLARDLVASTPVIFLDEFQLPDRAAAKILSTLFTGFFQLGGVLIATSNRLPEELSKAYGVDFQSAPAKQLSFKQRLLASTGVVSSSHTYNETSDFASFLEVLRARCDVWNIEGSQDWRRVDTNGWGTGKDNSTSPDKVPIPHIPKGDKINVDDSSHGPGTHTIASGPTKLEQESPITGLPRNYYVASKELLADGEGLEWSSSIRNIFHRPGFEQNSILWQETPIRVYGRDVSSKSYDGVAMWNFSTICGTSLGPADYISLASNFHTFIIDKVPILTILHKNEARRFITLLDALYEARCKLLIRADANTPDALFFPELRSSSTNLDHTSETNGDGTYPETFSEIYQDQTAPFRPNISSYTPTASPPSYEHSPLPHLSQARSASSLRSILADEDSDFGTTHIDGLLPNTEVGARESHVRLSGSKRADRAHSRTALAPDFQQTSSFIGEDEKFAYKRASSRLWEMCGARWWDHATWRPLPMERRIWEGSQRDRANSRPASSNLKDPSINSSGNDYKQDTSTYRTREDSPPKMSWVHIWGLMSSWGPKAGPVCKDHSLYTFIEMRYAANNLFHSLHLRMADTALTLIYDLVGKRRSRTRRKEKR